MAEFKWVETCRYGMFGVLEFKQRPNEDDGCFDRMVYPESDRISKSAPTLEGLLKGFHRWDEGKCDDWEFWLSAHPDDTITPFNAVKGNAGF